MPKRRSKRVVLYIGVMGCITAALCSPPLAEHVLALEPLHPEDVVPLGAFSILLLGVSALVTFHEFRMRENLAATIRT